MPGSHATGMLRRGAGGGACGHSCGEQRTRLSKLALALTPTLPLKATAVEAARVMAVEAARVMAVEAARVRAVEAARVRAVEAARVRAVEARRGAATHVFLTASKIIWPREVTPSPRCLRSSSPCSARVGVR